MSRKSNGNRWKQSSRRTADKVRPLGSGRCHAPLIMCIYMQRRRNSELNAHKQPLRITVIDESDDSAGSLPTEEDSMSDRGEPGENSTAHQVSCAVNTGKRRVLETPFSKDVIISPIGKL